MKSTSVRNFILSVFLFSDSANATIHRINEVRKRSRTLSKLKSPSIATAFAPNHLFSPRNNITNKLPRQKRHDRLKLTNKINENEENNGLSETFDKIVNSRYACTRFQPSITASQEEAELIKQKALEALKISQRAPSGFNAQPYKAIFIHTPEQKQKISKYCLGRNASRVLESFCTVIFLADLQCGKTFPKLKELLLKQQDESEMQSTKKSKTKKKLTPFVLRKIQVLILLFSSGYPVLPTFISKPISSCIRFCASILSVLSRRRVLTPSLSNAEVWATKNTMLFAMTYMLACTSRNLVTCPMEGYNAGGIKKVLGVPQRQYKVPLIVSVGLPYSYSGDSTEVDEDSDDAGMSHGNDIDDSDAKGKRGSKQKRFDIVDVVYENHFGNELSFF